MSIQCTKIKPDGTQCKNRTLKGPTCYIHALQRGLRVKISSIPDAQMGLFATKDYRRNELIDEYKGSVIEGPSDAIEDNKDYIISLNNNYHIDGEDPNSSFARFINDKRRHANTKFTADNRNRKINVRAKNNIRATKKHPKELYVSYGRDYWRRWQEAMDRQFNE